MNKRTMNYLEYKERYFKGERFEDIILVLDDLSIKNQFLKDLANYGKLPVQKDLPQSTQTHAVFGELLKKLESNLSDEEKLLLKRPVEQDTSIIDLQFAIFRECAGLFEYWFWDGFWGGSLIILKKDLPPSNSEEFIRSLLSQVNYSPEKPFTTKEKGDYVFINYNFHESEK